jgi:hypothetical protein
MVVVYNKKLSILIYPHMVEIEAYHMQPHIMGLYKHGIIKTHGPGRFIN